MVHFSLDKYNTLRGIPNVEYDVYAAEDIMSQDNHETQRYQKDEKIARVITNENGEAILEGLPQGKYYLKEITSGNGFSLKQEWQEVEITYEGQEVPVIFKTLESEEARQTVDITIKNVDEQTKEKTEGGSYGIYNKEEIRYQTENGETKVIPPNTLLYITEPDENGEIKFAKETNIDLPLGDYVIKEITPPKGHIKEDAETEEIEVSAKTEGGEEQSKISIIKEKQRTRTKVKVQFKEKEEMIKGMEFSIKEKETGEIVASTRPEGKALKIEETEEGYYVEKLLIGDYRLVEEEIPYSKGYVEKQEIDIQIEDTLEEQIIQIEQPVSKLEISIKDQETEENISNAKIELQNEEGNIVASTEEKENTLKIQKTEKGYYVEKLPIVL